MSAQTQFNKAANKSLGSRNKHLFAASTAPYTTASTITITGTTTSGTGNIVINGGETASNALLGSSTQSLANYAPLIVGGIALIVVMMRKDK
jgi:hypothetical protein